MFRKTGIGLAALAMLAPGLVAALGVGDYKLNSYLNQPLDMQVQLFDVGDLSTEEVLANLGSERDFESAGVERVFFLNDLQFEVKLNDKGDGTLTIRSVQPVREPFLSFVVEVMWPTGRLLREYTVLLDPPAFAEPVQRPAAAPVASQQSQAPATQPSATQPNESNSSGQRRIVAQSGQSQSAASNAPSRPDYVVQAADTMWRISLNNRPVNSVSVQQMLVAIQALNPDAFIDGNVNLVREGTVLRMPSEQDIRQISTRSAIADVAQQNREWRAKLEARGITLAPSRPQLDGSAKSGSKTEVAGASEGQVTLLSPDAKSGEGSGRGTGGASSTDSSALQNELAIRDENVDRLDRQNKELSGRLQDLQDQVTTSESLLKLRNGQIAQLQKQLVELQKAQGIAPSEPIVLEPVEDTSVEPQSSVVEDEAENTGEQAAADAVAVEDGDAASAEQAATVQTEPVVSKPVQPVTPEPVAQPSLVDLLMANLLYIVAGIIAIIVLLGGMVWMRNRQQSEQEFDEQDDDISVDDDFFAATDNFADEDEDEDEEQLPASEPEQDILEEVDVYTAYGRHAEAVTFLKNEIQQAPQREDLKVRLLEVLAEMRDRDGFEQQASAFADAGATVSAAISSLRSGFAGGAEEPSLDDLESDLTSSFDTPAQPTSKDETLDFELGSDSDDLESMDDLDLDLDLDLGESKPAEAPVVAAEEDEEDELSFDLSFEETPRLEAEPELSLEDDGLSLDLDDEQTDEDDELSLELDAGDDALSLELDDEPVKKTVALDDISADLAEDVDFGELSLADMSDEFSEASEKAVDEELDLSLDELSLDDLSLDDDEPTQVSMPAIDLDSAATDLSLDGEDELSLDEDELSLDDDLSLEDPSAAPSTDETATAAHPALESDVEPALAADDDDFDFLGDTDENATKLDLAKAYIDMGDAEGARDILQEVVSEGSEEQQQEAKELLAQVG